MTRLMLYQLDIESTLEILSDVVFIVDVVRMDYSCYSRSEVLLTFFLTLLLCSWKCTGWLVYHGIVYCFVMWCVGNWIYPKLHLRKSHKGFLDIDQWQ